MLHTRKEVCKEGGKKKRGRVKEGSEMKYSGYRQPFPTELIYKYWISVYGFNLTPIHLENETQCTNINRYHFNLGWTKDN